MTCSRALLVLLLAMSIPIVGRGENFSCRNSADTFLTPAHPGPDDPIGWFTTSDIEGVPAGWTTLAKVILSPGNLIHIDVVVTADIAAFPGYEPVRSAPRSGVFGPLPSGRYVVESTVRTFDLATQTSTLQCTAKPAGYTIFSEPGPTAASAVIEFYNPALDHYFITQDADEIHNLDSGVISGWTRTGQEFAAYLPHQSDFRGVAVARFYGVPAAGLDSHLFTTDSREIEAIVTGRLRGAWVYESADAFEVPPIDTGTGTCPPNAHSVYRLWNGRPDSNHRYTADPAVRQRMINLGYIPEGYGPASVFMCAL